MRRLRLIAGPNGSGKTTLTDALRSEYDVPLGQYTNPDEIKPNGYLDIYEQVYYQVQPDWFRINVLMRWDKNKVRVVKLST